MLVFIWDVTGQKEIEEQLKESENKFTTVFMNSPFVLTLISGTDQKFTDVNEKFVNQTGYSVEETIGKTPGELGIFQDNNEYKALLAAIRERGAIDNYEIKCRKKRGDKSLLFHIEIYPDGWKAFLPGGRGGYYRTEDCGRGREICEQETKYSL